MDDRSRDNPPANKRLRAARERLFLQRHDVARATGLQYYDMEDHNDELWSASSLKDVMTVCAFLHILPRSLFAVSDAVELPDISYTFGDIRGLVQCNLEASAITAERFGDRAGWAIEEFLQDSNSAWEWSVDELKDVCSLLEINWIDALPLTS